MSEEDLWSTKPTASPRSSPPERDPSHDGTAFPQPADVVIDMDEGSVPQGNDAPKSKSKPNFVILGAAALIGLAVVAGGGWMAMKMRSAPASRVAAPSPASIVSPAAVGVAAGSAADVFVAASSSSASAPTPAAGTDIFAAQAASAAASSADVAAAPASAQAAVALQAPSPPGQASAQTGNEAKVATTGDKAAVKTNQPRQVKAAAARPSEVRRSKPARAVTVARRGGAGSQKGKASASAKQPANASETVVPAFVLMGVYPLSGKDAQAWLRSSGGKTVVVRAGDTVEGVAIEAVVPERRLVQTSMGDLTSRGFAR